MAQAKSEVAGSLVPVTKQQARPALADRLEAAGATVRRLGLYETVPADTAGWPEQADAGLVASPSAVRSLL